MQHIPLLVVCVTMGGSTVGCASSLEELTIEERIQLQHEKEDKRLVRRDELIQYLNACDAHPRLIIVEVIKSGRSTLPNSRKKAKAKRETGYPYTHNNVSKWARRSNILCMEPQTIIRQLGY